MQIKNFGRNVLITPVNVYSPENENEVLEILNRHRGNGSVASENSILGANC